MFHWQTLKKFMKNEKGKKDGKEKEDNWREDIDKRKMEKEYYKE